jgi:ribosomal protein L37AE/L43A
VQKRKKTFNLKDGRNKMPDYKPKCERCESENVYPSDEKKTIWCCRDCGKTGKCWDDDPEEIKKYNEKRTSGKSLASYMAIASIAGGPYSADFARAASSLRKMNDADRGKVK